MSELIPLEDPEGHRWVRPAGPLCPNCSCCRAFVCESKEWSLYPWPNGVPELSCPCEQAHWDELVERARKRKEMPA